VARDRRASGIVTLLTDFGTADGYVGAMKGVILGINRDARIVDVTHEVRPQDVAGGAFALHTAHCYFPRGTVHVAVVDPGVGTDRAGVIVDSGDALFVAPDNGLLSFVLRQAARGDRTTKAPGTPRDTKGEGAPQPPTPNPQPLPQGWRAVRLAEPRFWLPAPSNTFHGRDIFAPVAAHLSLGEPPESFGPEMDELVALSIPEPVQLEDGAVRGIVLHVDRFGNLITNLRAPDLPARPLQIEIGTHRIEDVSRTYAEGRGLIALIGSSGYLEVALSGGSAQAEIGVGVGAEVRALPPAHSPRKMDRNS
jgi:S-adenosyl-L-methionine hydrolase (adenosine-forming)